MTPIHDDIAARVTDTLNALAAENKRLRSLLDGRDEFLVQRGLFGEFIEWLKRDVR